MQKDTLIINQNYHKYWKTKEGLIKNYNGLIAIDTPALGKYSIVLYYISPPFLISEIITILTLIILIIFLYKIKNKF